MLMVALPACPRPGCSFCPRLVADPRVIAEFPLQKCRAGESHFPISRFQKSPHRAPWMLCAPVECQ